jgi:hypothetical protein
MVLCETRLPSNSFENSVATFNAAFKFSPISFTYLSIKLFNASCNFLRSAILFLISYFSKMSNDTNLICPLGI